MEMCVCFRLGQRSIRMSDDDVTPLRRMTSARKLAEELVPRGTHSLILSKALRERRLHPGFPSITRYPFLHVPQDLGVLSGQEIEYPPQEMLFGHQRLP